MIVRLERVKILIVRALNQLALGSVTLHSANDDIYIEVGVMVGGIVGIGGVKLEVHGIGELSASHMSVISCDKQSETSKESKVGVRLSAVFTLAPYEVFLT